MTLDELRLRVMAAFPGCSVVRHRNMRADPFVYVELPEPVLIEGVSTSLVSFVALSDELGLAVAPVSLDGYCDRDLWATQDEIERRILAVSAHQLLAARRSRAHEVAS